MGISERGNIGSQGTNEDVGKEIGERNNSTKILYENAIRKPIKGKMIIKCFRGQLRA